MGGPSIPSPLVEPIPTGPLKPRPSGLHPRSGWHTSSCFTTASETCRIPPLQLYDSELTMTRRSKRQRGSGVSRSTQKKQKTQVTDKQDRAMNATTPTEHAPALSEPDLEPSAVIQSSTREWLIASTAPSRPSTVDRRINPRADWHLLILFTNTLAEVKFPPAHDLLNTLKTGSQSQNGCNQDSVAEVYIGARLP